jgi:carboxypeptidase family protein
MTAYRIALRAAHCTCLAALAFAGVCRERLLEPAAAPRVTDADASAAHGSEAARAPPSAPGAPADAPAPSERAATAADGVLEVVVVHAGDPQGGADVRAYTRHGFEPGTGAPAWRLAATAASGADGVAALPLAPGTYLIAARAAGLAPRHLAVVRPAGEARTRVTVALAPGVAVSGRVLARGRDEPVPLALLSLAPAGEGALAAMDVPLEERVSTTADPTGRFRFTVAPGAYVLEGSATGFTHGRIAVTAPRDGAELRLAAGAVVEGFVRGRDGAPAAGAEVLLSGGEELVRGTAGSSGGFAVEVTPGTYKVTARSDRAAGTWPALVTVAAGGRARGIEIWLGRPGGIAGVVTATDGAPVQGASIAVSPHEASGDLGRAETDGAGRFAVEGLGEGTYDVAVTAEGWSAAARTGLALLAAERAELAIALERSGGVEGTVKDGEGRPIAGVRVRCEQRRGAAPGGARAEARTDAAGRYRLTGLDAGRAEVVAARDDASSGVSASVDVPAGSSARADLTLADTGRLEGLVTRRDRGRVGPAVVVVLTRGAPMVVASAKVEADGRYALRLAAGEYRAVVVPGEVARADLRQPPVPVRIAAGQVSTVDLVLDGAPDGPGSAAVVQVLDSGRSGSAGALVMITAGDDLRSAGSGVTDEDGFARVELAERGSLKVRAYRGGRVGGPVPLASGGPTVVTLREAAQLRGRVVAPDGPPVAGFTLELAALGDDASVAGSLGGAAGARSAHGVLAPRAFEFGGDRFELADVPAGPVRIQVRTPGGRAGLAELSLAPGELREAEVLLEAGATVQGRAVDARSRSPVAGASVVALTRDRSAGRPEATTDTAGRFRLTGLVAGPRRLRLVAPGYAPAEREATLGHLEDVDLGDIALGGAVTR